VLSLVAATCSEVYADVGVEPCSLRTIDGATWVPLNDTSKWSSGETLGRVGTSMAGRAAEVQHFPHSFVSICELTLMDAQSSLTETPFTA
jgi:hypothetical protein